MSGSHYFLASKSVVLKSQSNISIDDGLAVSGFCS
jgi:hypothetical protein